MGSSERPRILVADDEANLRKVLAVMLRREGYEVLEAKDGLEAMGLLDATIAAVVTDLRMPQKDGMSLLRHAVAEHPDVPVILITAHGSVDSAVEAVKLGAFDYIEKPFEHSQIRSVVEKAVKTHALSSGEQRVENPASGRHGLIGRSPSFEQIFTVLDRVADTPSTVLLTGESGTGKELVARALHHGSSRRSGAFIKINCAAIPKTLMESELFGYDKGAFTGAVSSKPGRFELANGGTLFLDEIGEIPIDMQVKLLRVLQESEFERVGGVKTLKVDVRLVAATNRDLQREVQAGTFREDLFYRLNVVPIWLPPLRERKEDIPLLVEHFLGKFNERLRKGVRSLEAAAMDKLIDHSWPGNIRELENVIERTMLFADGVVLKVSDLPADLGGARNMQTPAPAPVPVPVTTTTTTTTTTPMPSTAFDVDKTPPPQTTATTTPAPVGSLKDLVKRETDRLEREIIVRALDETGGNVTQTAKLLKISRKSLQLKMKEFGLRDRDPTSGSQ